MAESVLTPGREWLWRHPHWFIYGIHREANTVEPKLNTLHCVLCMKLIREELKTGKIKVVLYGAIGDKTKAWRCRSTLQALLIV